MNKKILSISIAAYNVEKTLDKCISSLLNKECIDFLDIIIVNDGSKDGTEDIARKYVEKYPNSITLINKENGGYGSTINASLKIAKGKYYRLLDGDDEYNTNILTDYIIYLNNTNADIVFSPYVLKKENSIKKVDELNDLNVNKKYDYSEITNSNYLAMHGIAVMTEILQSHSIKIEEKKYYSDNEFLYYVLKYTKIIEKYRDPIYIYNLQSEGQSVSIQGIKKHYKDQLFEINKIVNDFSKNKIDRNNHDVIYRFIYMCVYCSYHYCLVVADKDAKNELMLFDKELFGINKNLYMKLNKSLKIRLLRKSNFMLYKLISLYEREFIKESN